ncbi:MAG TPA: hypothetical protein VF556_07205 [Pyrinomonadaceae bacterium]|jgi:hypothetical protein
MQWKDVISHYEQLISENFDYVPLLEIVKKITNSKYVNSVFPTFSHDALIISRADNFRESFNYPSICIQYFGEEEFKVSYSPNSRQTHNISKLYCNFKDVWSYLESLFLRQRIETDLIKYKDSNL